MAEASYFLGANTPEGFQSQYDTLFHDPRVDLVLILKGGAGCGKSTLMKKVGAKAEELGHTAEGIPCSSDPDSLDGIVIPDARLALVDGTAPHVTEPPLCGLRANYLNLGQYYDMRAVSLLGQELSKVKARNAACYEAAYGLLRSAGALTETLRKLTLPHLTKEITALSVGQLLPPIRERGGAPGNVCFRYLTAITPKGLIALTPRLQTLWAIEDGCGLGSAIMERMKRIFVRAGYDVVCVLSPMEPGLLAGLLVPQMELGYLRCDTLFGLGGEAELRLELDSVIEEECSSGELEHLAFLQEQIGILTQEAIFHLRRAKRLHDRLEALYRPTVDFAGVGAETERVIELLVSRLSKA